MVWSRELNCSDRRSCWEREAGESGDWKLKTRRIREIGLVHRMDGWMANSAFLSCSRSITASKSAPIFTITVRIVRILAF